MQHAAIRIKIWDAVSLFPLVTLSVKVGETWKLSHTDRKNQPGRSAAQARASGRPFSAGGSHLASLSLCVNCDFHSEVPGPHF